MTKSNEPKQLQSPQLVPSSTDLLHKLTGVIATEIARIQVKQSNTNQDLGLTGAKQINELLKSLGGIDEQQEKYEKRDAVSKLTDEQSLEILSKIISELPEEKQQLLFRTLLNDPAALE